MFRNNAQLGRSSAQLTRIGTTNLGNQGWCDSCIRSALNRPLDDPPPVGPERAALGLMNTTTDILVAAILLFPLLAPYTLYPLLVRLGIRPRKAAPAPAAARLPTVSILIPVHHQGQDLEAKIENTLALEYPRERLEILLASDGPDPRTRQIVQSYADAGVLVIEMPPQQSKLAALDALITRTRGETILFTDLGILLPPSALLDLAAELGDPNVGIALPRCVFRGHGKALPNRNPPPKGRVLEAERDMPMGEDGRSYLIRRDALSVIPEDTVNPHSLWRLRACEKGWGIAYGPDVEVWGERPERPSVLFERTARAAEGNLQLLWRERRLLRPKHGRLALNLIAETLAKTLSPAFLLAGLLWLNFRAAVTPSLHPLAWAIDGVLGLLFVAMAWRVAGQPLPWGLDWGARALAAQLGTAAGILRFPFPVRSATTRWSLPPDRLPLALDAPALPPRSVRIAKRAVDVVGATVGILLALPLTPFIALAIRLNSPGPAFYRQERTAKDLMGRPHLFLILKFRTMRVDAEADGQPVWAQEKDPRITGVGAFLRKTRLDELPQLFQVLRGEMTLIGPRPERPSISDDLATRLPGYDDRLAPCKPGITGWAQIHTGYDTSIDSVREKLLYDFTYNAHLYRMRSYVAMEARVIVGTLSVMFYGRGAR